MKKFIQLHNLPIAYQDNEAKGDPIVFLHGNSLSAATFKQQFTSQEFKKHRLLAPDMPGHGESKPAKEPEIFYTLDGFTQIMVSWLDALNITNAVMVGHSMGGHMLMGAWPQISQRAKALVIFGTPPLTKPLQMEHIHYDHPSYSLTFQAKLNAEEIIELANTLIKKNTGTPKVITDSIKKADSAMRPILGASSSDSANLSDEAENIRQMKKPIAILQGRYDQTLKRTYFDRLEIPTLWRGKVQLIDNAGHCPQLENPAQFNQLLQQFLIDQLI